MNAISRTPPHAGNSTTEPSVFKDCREASTEGVMPQQFLDAERQAFEQFFGYQIEVLISDAHRYFFINAPQGFISHQFTKAWSSEGYVQIVAAELLMSMRISGEDDLFTKVEGYE